MESTKICTHCEVERPLSDFYTDKRAKDGKRSDCKFCTKQRNDKAYQQITDERRRYVREWKAKHPGKTKEYSKRQYAKGKRYKEQAKEYRQKNSERIRENARKYLQENKEAARQRERRYRARKQQATIENVTEKGWMIIVQAYQSRCAYCGKQCDPPTMDHIIPISKGGSHSYGNIIPACLSCNCRKSTRTPEQAGMPIIIEALPFSIPQ